jgi:glycosyltransferase involved in cell wall biosynthesis
MNIEHAPRISIILPAYFEEKTIANVIRKLHASLLERFESLESFEVIVVVDGLVDGTETILRSLSLPNLRLIVFEENKGKGAAISTGIRNAKATELISYMDSDMDIDVSSLMDGLLRISSQDEVVMLAGSKVHSLSDVNYPLWRKILSLIFSKFVQTMLNLEVRDTQTGLKIARARQLKECLPEFAINGWALDVAILQNMKRRNYRVEEMPVKIDYGSDTRLNFINSARAVAEVFKIRKNQKDDQC